MHLRGCVGEVPRRVLRGGPILQRWEYQAWDVEYRESPGSDDENPVLALVAINDEVVKEVRVIWDALNEAGRLGWELVSVTREEGYRTVLMMLLKRLMSA
jgi:hypothetical protein